jgi:hypothetical protein
MSPMSQKASYYMTCTHLIGPPWEGHRSVDGLTSSGCCSHHQDQRSFCSYSNCALCRHDRLPLGSRGTPTGCEILEKWSTLWRAWTNTVESSRFCAHLLPVHPESLWTNVRSTLRLVHPLFDQLGQYLVGQVLEPFHIRMIRHAW